MKKFVLLMALAIAAIFGGNVAQAHAYACSTSVASPTVTVTSGSSYAEDVHFAPGNNTWQDCTGVANVTAEWVDLTLNSYDSAAGVYKPAYSTNSACSRNNTLNNAAIFYDGLGGSHVCPNNFVKQTYVFAQHGVVMYNQTELYLNPVWYPGGILDYFRYIATFGYTAGGVDHYYTLYSPGVGSGYFQNAGGQTPFGYTY